MLADGHAYHSNATAEDVKAYKQEHGADRGFRGQPEAEGAVRLHVPDDGYTSFVDAVRGEVSFPNASMDDPVIARADGSVLYNFAVAVDDLDSRITHVVRGEDHISNTPKQLLVFEALGATPPKYAHLPLLHGPDGKKLSKRHGAASVQELRDRGYLPEAVNNYIALLGTGFAPDEEFFTMAEMAERFRLDRVSKSPAVFDEQKLRHINGQHLRALSMDELTRTPRALHRPPRAAAGGRDLTREDSDAGGLLAACGLPVRRAGRRSEGICQGDRLRRRPRGARRGSRGARRARAVHGGARSSRRCARSWSNGT